MERLLNGNIAKQVSEGVDSLEGPGAMLCLLYMLLVIYIS